MMLNKVQISFRIMIIKQRVEDSELKLYRSVHYILD